jgi:hypothetical protein
MAAARFDKGEFMDGMMVGPTAARQLLRCESNDCGRMGGSKIEN